MGQYTLPDMPYDYAALEPAITGEILELHHAKHHAAYVKGANDTLEKLAEARDKSEFGGLVGLEKTFAFNLSGHVLHSIFWQNLSPTAVTAPTERSVKPSSSTSAPSRPSASSSPPPPRPSRDPGGASWRGSRWAGAWSLSRCMTITVTSA